jgi:hypothetical protein
MPRPAPLTRLEVKRRHTDALENFDLIKPALPVREMPEGSSSVLSTSYFALRGIIVFE